MDHSKLQETIYALYDGELSGQALEEAKAHLAACGECARLYEGWKAASGVLFPKADPRPSEFFVHRTMELLRESAPARVAAESWSVVLRWLVPFTGLAVLSMVFVRPLPPVSFDGLVQTDAETAVDYETFDSILGE